MRLIDSDLFKENIRSGLYIFCQVNKEDICNAIDDEPTVEPNQLTQDIIDKVNVNIGLAQPIKDASWYYCPHCGADMRGKEE